MQIVIAVLLIVAVAAMSFGVWAIWFREPEVLDPDYAAKEPEKNAEQIEDTGGEKLDAPEGGGALSLIYAKEVGVDLSDGKLSMLVGNPAESTVYIVAEVVIQGHVIAQSGAIEPGFRVTELSLADGAKEILRVGGYDGKIVIYMYDSETDAKQIVNSEILVNITVSE